MVGFPTWKFQPLEVEAEGAAPKAAPKRASVGGPEELSWGWKGMNPRSVIIIFTL